MPVRRLVTTLVVCGALAPTAGRQLLAEDKRAMTFDDVMNVNTVTDPQLSPDGKWVAYVVTSVDMKENARNADIWLASTDRREPIRLTTHKKNDTQPRWSPDGKRVAFVSARDEKPQIFVMSPFGGEPEALTSSKAGVQSFQWSPDGTRIAYVAEDDPTPEDERRQKDKDDVQLIDQHFRFGRLWLVDVGTKAAATLVTGDFHVSDPQWAPDGRRLAYVTAPSPKADDGGVTDVWVVDATSKERKKLIENDGPDAAPRWSRDGRTIAIETRDAKKGLLGQSHLAVIPSDGGRPRDVTGSFAYEPGPPVWSADDRSLYFLAQSKTVSQLYRVSATGGEPTSVHTFDGTVNGLSIARGESALAFASTNFGTPGDVYVSPSLTSVAPTKVTDHNASIRQLSLARSEVVKWTGKDGLEIEGVLFYPVGYETGRSYPLIVQVHGGPSGIWANAFPASWANAAHVWAGKGWMVFCPNPRGSSGYGEKFLLANVRDWGGGDYQDIQRGVDVLIAKGLADPSRMGQTGWSYGGYMTAWTLTQTTRFKALMVGAGLTDMFSMYSTNDLQRILEGYFGAEPWDDPEMYYTRSAMNFIKKARTPTLIMHGGVDQRVPIGQAQELYMGLRKNQVPVEMAVYPREPHGLQEPRHQLDKMQREYAWFEKHVLPPPSQ
ncbi:MAG: S9 family peptidase [Vicinamibacterales bacterium]